MEWCSCGGETGEVYEEGWFVIVDGHGFGISRSGGFFFSRSILANIRRYNALRQQLQYHLIDSYLIYYPNRISRASKSHYER